MVIYISSAERYCTHFFLIASEIKYCPRFLAFRKTFFHLSCKLFKMVIIRTYQAIYCFFPL